MKDISKNNAKIRIDEYFSKENTNSKNTKKMKKLAMRFRISFKEYKKKFCKSCYSELRKGRIRISKSYKYVECPACKKRNSWKIR